MEKDLKEKPVANLKPGKQFGSTLDLGYFKTRAVLPRGDNIPWHIKPSSFTSLSGFLNEPKLVTGGNKRKIPASYLFEHQLEMFDLAEPPLYRQLGKLMHIFMADFEDQQNFALRGIDRSLLISDEQAMRDYILGSFRDAIWLTDSNRKGENSELLDVFNKLSLQEMDNFLVKPAFLYAGLSTQEDLGEVLSSEKDFMFQIMAENKRYTVGKKAPKRTRGNAISIYGRFDQIRLRNGQSEIWEFKHSLGNEPNLNHAIQLGIQLLAFQTSENNSDYQRLRSSRLSWKERSKLMLHPETILYEYSTGRRFILSFPYRYNPKNYLFESQFANALGQLSNGLFWAKLAYEAKYIPENKVHSELFNTDSMVRSAWGEVKMRVKRDGKVTEEIYSAEDCYNKAKASIQNYYDLCTFSIV